MVFSGVFGVMEPGIRTVQPAVSSCGADGGLTGWDVLFWPGGFGASCRSVEPGGFYSLWLSAVDPTATSFIEHNFFLPPVGPDLARPAEIFFGEGRAGVSAHGGVGEFSFSGSADFSVLVAIHSQRGKNQRL